MSPMTFIGFLFENYLDFYSSIDDIAQASQYLSLTDFIVHEWEVEYICYWMNKRKKILL
jgi:hypothetical protein